MPSDPFILLSMINMKLRDNNYSGPEEMCDDLDWDFDIMNRKLADAGFEYNPDIRQYR